MSFEVILCLGSPGGVSCEHFVENDSNSPYIALRTVKIFIESLQRHIDRRAHIIVGSSFEVGVSDGEPEVSYFDLAVIEEDIGWFKVSMYDTEAIDTPVAIDDLFENGDGFGLIDFPFVFDGFGEVSSFAEFGDDVGLRFLRDDVVEQDDVL